MDKPKGLKLEADRPRADSQMKAQFQMEDRQTCNRHIEAWRDLKKLTETWRYRDIS